MGFFLVQGKEGLMAVAEKTEVCDADEKVIEMELERLRTFENLASSLRCRLLNRASLTKQDFLSSTLDSLFFRQFCLERME